MIAEHDRLVDELRDELADARAESRSWRMMAKVAIEHIASLTVQNARLRVCLASRREEDYENRRVAA